MLYVLPLGPVNTLGGWKWGYQIKEELKEVDEEGSLTPDYNLKSPLKGTWVGAIFVMEGKAKGNGIEYRAATVKFEKELPHELSVKLRAVANAAQSQMRTEKSSKDLDWRENLKPIREAYRASRGAAKAVLLNKVIAYIAGGGK